MKPLIRLLPLMKPVWRWMALSVLLATLAMMANIALIATSGWFITAMAFAGMAGVTLNYFTPGAMIRGFAIARTAGRYAERVVGHDATLRFVSTLRPWLFARLVPLAPAHLADLRSGDLLSRLRGDIDRLELAFLRIVSPVLVAIIVLFSALLWLASRQVAMASLVAGLVAAAAIGIPVMVYRFSSAVAGRMASRQAAFSAQLVDHIEGLAELAIYDPDHRHRDDLLARSDALMADEERLATLASTANAGVILAANLAMTGVLFLGLPLVAAGTLPPADLPMLALLVLALFEAVGPLPMAMQALPAVSKAAERIFMLADRRPMLCEPDQPKKPPESGALTFSNVSLTYPGATNPALQQLSFVLEPQARLGIVGPSGSGKSSVVSLIMRFTGPDQGEIRFAGQSIKDYSGDSVREQIALLAQDEHLFSGTIRDNLLIGNPSADVEALREACRQARILPFIEAQPDGFDTFIGAHGTKVSGGEGRRIALARTLLKPAAILILDEPTEGLDQTTGRAVLGAIMACRSNQAIVLITHQPTLLESMDCVLRIEKGRGGIESRKDLSPDRGYAL